MKIEIKRNSNLDIEFYYMYIYILFCRNCDKPRLIEALKSKRVRDIACGSSHSAAITSNGDLYTWGLGEYGRLGHGDTHTQLKPKQVMVMHNTLVCLKSINSDSTK